MKFRKFFAMLMALVMLFSFQTSVVSASEIVDIPSDTQQEVVSEVVPVENAPVEDAPVEDAPVEDAPVEDAPVEDEPVEDVPVEDEPVEDAPVEDAPIEDAPVEDAPVEDAPVEDAPVEDAPVEDAPVEDAPVEDAPVEDAPVEDVPVEDAPVEDAPVEDVPVEDAPVEDAPVEDVPVEDDPVEDAPAEDTPVEDAPVEDAPAEDTPVEDAPVEDVPVDDTPVEDAPMEDVPVEDVSAEEAPVEDAPVEGDPAVMAEGVMMLAAEPATYDVNFYLYTETTSTGGGWPGGGQSSTRQVPLSYVEFMISDSENNTVAYPKTNDDGEVTVSLPNGAYVALISYTSGNREYYAKYSFTVNGAEMDASIKVAETYTEASASEVYERTSYFNHVDIRVKGTYTTGTTDSLTTYNITLKNAKISVKNAGNYSNFTADFSNQDDETYEWRKTGVKVHKNAEVTLTCDIYVDGEYVAAYTQTFKGKSDFIQAIKQCDMNQGLDFIINPEDIIEIIYSDVSYQWAVVGEDASLAAALKTKLDAIASPPATTTGYAPGDDHTVNTTWSATTNFIVEYNGEYYRLHFNGWSKWKDEDTAWTALNGAAALEITSDTDIYGEWTFAMLPDVKGFGILTKTFVGIPREHIVQTERWFTITTPDGTTDDVEFSEMTWDENGNLILSYRYPLTQNGTFSISESNADMPGYTLTGTTAEAYANIVAPADAAATIYGGSFEVVENKNTSIKVKLELPQSEDANVDDVQIGVVAFTNTYGRNANKVVHEYPALVIDKQDEEGNVLEGATFELRPDNIEGMSAQSGTTNVSGYTSFVDLMPGSYELVETKAPAGYLAGYAKYEVIVAEKETSPVVELVDGEWIETHSYDMEVWVSLDGGSTWHESQHFAAGTTGNRFRLVAYNQKITGSLTITKDIAGDLSENAFTAGAISLKVEGPNGYSTVVSLPTADGAWSETLTGLELGEYKVSEISADKTGYNVAATYSPAGGAIILSDEGATSTVVAGAIDVTNTYTKVYTDPKVNYAEIDILKLREGTDIPLSGAVFTLYNQNGTAAGTSTTGDSGRAGFGGLVEGTYYLEETTAPAGHLSGASARYTIVVEKTVEDVQLESGVWQEVTTHAVTSFTDASGNAVTGGTTSENPLKVYNKKITGSMTIRKEFGENNEFTPESVTVKITGPASYSTTVTLSAAGDWTATLTGLELGEYVVAETGAGQTGYALTTTYSADGGKVNLIAGDEPVTMGEIAITNTYTKVYTDPRYVTPDIHILKLRANSDEALSGAQFTLYNTADNAVAASGVTDENGKLSLGIQTAGSYRLVETAAPATYAASAVSYTIVVGVTITEELLDSGLWQKVYTYSVASFKDSDGNDVTTGLSEEKPLNVYNAKAVGSLTVAKAFGTDNGYNPESVTLTVTGPDGSSKDVVLSAANNWQTTLENLPFGEYKVSESKDANSADGYELYTSVNPEGGEVVLSADNYESAVTVTNTYADLDSVPGSFTVSKTDGTTGEALEGVEFGLYSGDTKIASAITDENGEATFSGFVREATYRVREEAPLANYEASADEWTVTVTETLRQETVDGKRVDRYYYTATVDAANGSVLNVKNYRKLGDLVIAKEEKFWVDDIEAETAPDGRGGLSYTFLVTIGDAEPEEVEIRAGESKTYEDIPYGTTYTVEEVVPEGAVFSNVIENGTGTIAAETTEVDVINHYYYTIDNPGFSAIKLDADTKQPVAGAGFTLYADAACTTAIATATSDAQGKVNLPIVAEGTFYLKETVAPAGYHPNGSVYTVKAEISYEVITDEYGYSMIHQRMIVTSSDLSAVEDEAIHYTYIIENTAIKDVGVSVQKVWKDGEYLAGRPDSIEVTLLRDGEEFQNVTLNKANGWYYAWTGLTDEYDWEVDEKSAYADYEKTVSRNGDAWTITNTREVIDIEGVKVWNLNGYERAVIPENVTIRLYADGSEVASTTATVNSDWAWSFGAMPKTMNGEPVEYTVIEDAVADFETAITGNAADGFTVTNTYKTAVIEGVKVWDLNGYESVVIPESITVRLYADGSEVASTTADEAGDWSWSFGAMPATKNGKEIVYTISEDAIEDFVPAVTGDVATGFILTNTYDPKLGGLTISKTVKGNGADEKQAFTFTLTLTGMTGELSYTGAANGTFDASEPLVFTLAHGQSITIEGIIEGTQYEVVEAEAKDYMAAVTNGSGTITEGEAIRVDFVNTYEGDDDEVTIPKTGDSGNRAAMPVLAGLAIMWLGVAWYVIKRKLFA